VPDTPRRTPPGRRILTLFAVGCLTLDGVLLVLAGLWGRRLEYAIGGGLCLLGALLVLHFWKRHRRSLAALAAARRDLRDEARALRDLIRR